MPSRSRNARTSSASFRSRISWNPPVLVCTIFVAIPFAHTNCLSSYARDGPQQNPAVRRLMPLIQSGFSKNPRRREVKAASEMQHLLSRTHPSRDPVCLQNSGLTLWTVSLQCLRVAWPTPPRACAYRPKRGQPVLHRFGPVWVLLQLRRSPAVSRKNTPSHARSAMPCPRRSAVVS